MQYMEEVQSSEHAEALPARLRGETGVLDETPKETVGEPNAADDPSFSDYLEREDLRDASIPEGLLDAETPTPRFNPVLNDLKISQSFIELLEKAALESDVEPLPSDVIQQLRNPPSPPSVCR